MRTTQRLQTCMITDDKSSSITHSALSVTACHAPVTCLVPVTYWSYVQHSQPLKHRHPTTSVMGKSKLLRMPTFLRLLTTKVLITINYFCNNCDICYNFYYKLCFSIFCKAVWKTEHRSGPNRPKIWHPFRRFSDRNCEQFKLKVTKITLLPFSVR